MLLLTGVAGDSVIRFKVFVGCCWLSCARCILRPLNFDCFVVFFSGVADNSEGKFGGVEALAWDLATLLVSRLVFTWFWSTSLPCMFC